MESKKRLQSPEQDALEHIRRSKDKSFLEERRIDAIDGKNVFFLILLNCYFLSIYAFILPSVLAK